MNSAGFHGEKIPENGPDCWPKTCFATLPGMNIETVKEAENVGQCHNGKALFPLFTLVNICKKTVKEKSVSPYFSKVFEIFLTLF